MRLALCLGLFITVPAFSQQNQPAPEPPPEAIPPLQTSIVVLGTPEPVPAGESARSGVSLDTQRHRLASPDIEDYLRTDSSVDIQQRGAAGVQSDISIRGTSFEQTLVLLNGLRINDAETSHFNLDVPVPLEALSTIDVLHGSGSTLYGSDAIGGVVDFITFKPEATTLRLRTGVGSFGENQQSVLASFASPRLSEVLSGTREHSNGFIPDRDFLTESASSETRITTPLGDTDLLFAGSNRPFGADQFYGPYNSFEHTKGWFASINQPLGPNTNVLVGYRRHSDLYILLRDNPAYYKNQHIDESWQAAIRRHQLVFKNTSLSYGLEENTDAIQSNNLGHHGRNRGAGYLNLDLRASQRGTISVGLREEVFSGGRSVFSPQFSGSLWLRHSLKLRASVGYGFRLPTYVDLYYSDPTHIANPNLKPESAWNYDGGADWYLNDRTVAALTVFYSRQTNAIDYIRTGPTAPYQASNLTGLHFTGVESSLDWHPTPRQQLRANWTLLFGAQQALHGLQSDYIYNYPTNNASLQWTQNWTQGLLLRTRLGVTQRYQQTAYPVWDVALAREAGRIHPFLRMANLTNTGYQEIANIPMPGRSFTGGFELTLTKASR
ncbi:TonB-dependent receptor [Granulicella sp. dw_53]|uniref:TonB-dependent receptor plug domain-containing protein n=1 Tax=Granulicella sp. dw_53 TaxID=2719792 RepID=UPI001BD568EF|nr:TonB-dependent receptor [Granulicella sp. dw_53]